MFLKSSHWLSRDTAHDMMGHREQKVATLQCSVISKTARACVPDLGATRIIGQAKEQPDGKIVEASTRISADDD